MRLLIDENLSHQVTRHLKALGYDVQHVREVGLKGHKDEEIWEYASKERRIIVTQNFGGFSRFWRFSRGECHTGLICLRLRSTPPSQIPAVIAKFLTDHVEVNMKGRMAVITDKRTRFSPPL